MRRLVFISSLFFWALSSGLSPGWEGTALAQAPEPSAFELAEKAKRAQDSGRLDEAIDGYAKAYQLSGEAVYLYSLADAHRQAGHLDDALRMYQTFVRRDPNGPNRPTADKQIKELEKQIAQAKAATPRSAAPVGALFPPGAKAPVVAAPPATPAPVAPPPAAVAPTAPAPQAGSAPGNQRRGLI